jgi:hypothetical protein
MAGSTSVAERASDSEGRCQNLIVLHAGFLDSVLFLEDESREMPRKGIMSST